MIKKALLNRLSKKADLPSDPISFDRANSVGILTIYEHSDNLDDLLKELEREGKSPRVVSFIANPIKNKVYPPHTFTAKDITMGGDILNSELLYFTKQKYDLLLSLDPSGNQFIKYLLAKTQARHRIGLYHPNFDKLLDMMIKPSAENNLAHDLLKYVKMIRHD